MSREPDRDHAVAPVESEQVRRGGHQVGGRAQPQAEWWRVLMTVEWVRAVPVLVRAGSRPWITLCTAGRPSWVGLVPRVPVSCADVDPQSGSLGPRGERYGPVP